MKISTFFLIIILGITMINSQTYSDCSIYGNCGTQTSSTTSNVNYTTLNVSTSNFSLYSNDTQFIRGYTPFNLPYLNLSGTNANQNINISPYNLTSNKLTASGYLINGGTHTDGKFLRADGTDLKLSTLIMPNAITDTYIPVATATNTIGSDAGLTYNDATDILTVQKGITITGGTDTTHGIISTGTFYVNQIDGANPTGQGSGTTIYSGTGGNNPSGIGGSGGGISLQGGSGGTGTTYGGYGGNFVLTAGEGGTSSNVSGATGGFGGSYQLYGGNGGTASSCTSGICRGGEGGSFGATGGSGGSLSSISGTAIAVGGSGGALTFGSGSGAQSRISGISYNTGGNGGLIAFTGSSGGRASFGSIISQGGNGSNVLFYGGNGGAATSSGGTQRGGKGGSLEFTAGTGGIATTSTVTSIGGDAGDMTFSVGTGGSGENVTGLNGNIYFKQSTTLLGLINGTTNDFKWLNDMWIINSKKLYFGTTKESSINYNGTDLLINPKETGSGKVYVQGSQNINDSLNVGNTITTKNCYGVNTLMLGINSNNILNLTKVGSTYFLLPMTDNDANLGTSALSYNTGYFHQVYGSHFTEDGTAPLSDGTYKIFDGAYSGSTDGTITIKDGLITSYETGGLPLP